MLFVGKKRRSQDVHRLVSRPASRPATSAGAEKAASPRPAKAIIDSLLKPQSPIFTPGQLYTPASPTRTIPEAYPTPVSKSSSPVRRASPSKRDGTASPNARPGRQTAPRPARTGNIQSRHITSEDAHRQSEVILQRQRDAIKRSAQIQEAQAVRAQQPQESKAPHREVELGPSATPVVIDPDDFGRDYTIRPSVNEPSSGGRGKGSGRRGGGRARGGKPQQQVHSAQPHAQPPPREPASAIQEARSSVPDFVLKSGSVRGSARGRGKLWVP